MSPSLLFQAEFSHSGLFLLAKNVIQVIVNILQISLGQANKYVIYRLALGGCFDVYKAGFNR